VHIGKIITRIYISPIAAWLFFFKSVPMKLAENILDSYRRDSVPVNLREKSRMFIFSIKTITCMIYKRCCYKQFSTNQKKMSHDMERGVLNF
jgi:hypothetical protein